jgi:hypothetical protein
VIIVQVQVYSFERDLSVTNTTCAHPPTCCTIFKPSIRLICFFFFFCLVSLVCASENFFELRFDPQLMSYYRVALQSYLAVLRRLEKEKKHILKSTGRWYAETLLATISLIFKENDCDYDSCFTDDEDYVHVDSYLYETTTHYKETNKDKKIKKPKCLFPEQIGVSL